MLLLATEWRQVQVAVVVVRAANKATVTITEYTPAASAAAPDDHAQIGVAADAALCSGTSEPWPCAGTRYDHGYLNLLPLRG
ncbi:MAG: hypothetical protein WCT04_05790 [Planctomycetota bacterium]